MIALAVANKKKLVALGRPGRAVGTHLRALEDSVNLFCWMQLPDAKDEFAITLADFAGATDIQGSKLDKPVDKAWYKAFRTVQQDFFKFIKEGYPGILRWTG